MNSQLITKLKEMRDLEKVAKQLFKVRAYDTVIRQLEKWDQPINNMADIDEANFTGIGKGIREKLGQIFKTGVIKQVEDKRNLMEAVKILSTVHGIGPTKANELVKKHGITTVEELADHHDLLNDVQIKGLKYYDDMQKRIPRAEMDKHNVFLTNNISSEFEIAGSYRRFEKTSGDIDVIMCDQDASAFDKVIKSLIKSKYIVEVLAHGEKKFMGICKLPRHKTFRRIDIMIMDRLRYPFALLYFTGSRENNIRMRNKALSLGYSLNEYGMTVVKGSKSDDVIPTMLTERAIFEFLELPYLEPKNR